MAAQSGAHLATSNVDKPSIFELVASHSLDSTFYPALKKIATVNFMFVYTWRSANFSLIFQYLGTLNPERYRVLNKHYDEIFLLLSGLAQHYYLSKNGKLSSNLSGFNTFT